MPVRVETGVVIKPARANVSSRMRKSRMSGKREGRLPSG